MPTLLGHLGQMLSEKPLHDITGGEQKLVPLEVVSVLPDQQSQGPLVGFATTYTRTVTDADVALFALVTGDQNPLHLDADYAATTHYGRRTVPAMLIGGLVEAALVAALPGVTGVACKESLTFPGPAFIDEPITVTLTVQCLSADGHLVTCAVEAADPQGKPVATGEVQCHIGDLPPAPLDADA